MSASLADLTVNSAENKERRKEENNEQRNHLSTYLLRTIMMIPIDCALGPSTTTSLKGLLSPGIAPFCTTAMLVDVLEDAYIDMVLSQQSALPCSSGSLATTAAWDRLRGVEGLRLYQRLAAATSDDSGSSSSGRVGGRRFERAEPLAVWSWDDIATREWRAVVSGFGGKGGFDKLISKKGRLYEKARRRGETDQTLRRLARNLQGERIGDAAPPSAEGDTPTVRRVSSHTRPRAAVPSADEAAERRQRLDAHAQRVVRREALNEVVAEAVATGVAVLLAKAKEKKESAEKK